MDKVNELTNFLESIRHINPDIVDSIVNGVEIIFESKSKKNKKKKIGFAYQHPYNWGGWFTGSYSGGISGVSGVADIGMGSPVTGGDGGAGV